MHLSLRSHHKDWEFSTAEEAGTQSKKREIALLAQWAKQNIP
jgi:hypothetical protein